MDHLQIIQSLRAALAVSPDNAPLRRHLADTLYQHGLYAEAETEYSEVLRLDPESVGVKTALARTFLQLEKTEAAAVVVEELLRQAATDMEVQMLHVRLLAKQNQFAQAWEIYQQVIIVSPELADEFLGKELEEKRRSDPEHWLRVSTTDEEVGSEVYVERPKVNFADVGGMDKVKEEISFKIIHPLKHPEIYKSYGKKTGGGILLYGPPGCGKTHLARATAGEVKAGFLAVGISDILDMYLGNSEQKLAAYFEQARRGKPCVLFFDEVDALGANRTHLKQGAGKTLVNQFLSELDGVDTDNEGVLTLAATNTPWHLDTAFLRPGRFDRIIFVPPPDEPARASILHILLKGKPAENIDYAGLARRTVDFSGADLKAVVDIAIEGKLQEAMRRGIPLPLTSQDLKAAAERHRPTTKEWFATARNYALYANESGLYDEVLTYLKIKR